MSQCHRLLGLLGIVLCLLGCGDDARPSVAITLIGIPGGVQRIAAAGTLGGAALPPREFSAGLQGGGPHLGYKLAPGQRGLFQLELKAFGDGQKLLGQGAGQVQIMADRRYDVSVAIASSDGNSTRFRVDVALTGEGSGEVTSEPPGIVCGDNCTGWFAPGTRVQLKATAHPRSRFYGWIEGCAGSNDCTLSVNENRVVKAEFFQKICSADSWCWENPLPQGNNLTGVWGTTDDNIWAVGEGGTILHWNGRSWSGSTSAPTHLQGIWGAAKDDIWAVGNSSLLLHYDGQGWSASTIPGKERVLFSVWGSRSNDVWTVGTAGSILHQSGQSNQWTETPSPVTADLRAVWGTSDRDAWAVGNAGTVLSWNGLSWSKIDHQLDAGELRGVWGSGVNDVWIVGIRSSSPKGTVLHWNGVKWELHILELNEVYDVWGTSAEDVWVSGLAGGRGRFYRFDGTKWSTVDSMLMPYSPYLYRMWGGTAGFWAVGNQGALVHFDGQHFTDHRSGHYAVSGSFLKLNRIWGSGAHNIFVVGAGETILRGDGERWVRMDPSVTKQSLQGVWGSGSTDVWAVGDKGTILHFNGEAWSMSSISTTADLYTVWGSGPDDAWTAGRTTLQFFRWNGSQWLEAPSTGLGEVRGFTGSGPKDAWAAHLTEVFRWDGTGAWRSIRKFGGNSVNAAWSSSASDVWFVGVGVFRWDGMRWQDAGLGGFVQTGLWGSDASNDLWTVGTSATIARIDRKTLVGTAAKAGSANSILWDIWGSSPTNIYAVGDYGTILHYQP